MIRKFGHGRVLTKFYGVVVLPFCFCYYAAHSQSRSGQGGKFTQFSFQYKAQPKRDLKDSAGYHFRSDELSLGAMIPVYSRLVGLPRQYQDRLSVFVTGDLKMNKIELSYLYNSRILLNAGAGAGISYRFKEKNTLTTLVHFQLREDEFTINDPVLRYNGMLLYSRKVNTSFSYRLGLAYTSIYGDLGATGFTFPAIGFKLRTGERSQLSATLPFHIAWLTYTGTRTRFTVTLKPSGNSNRYDNRNFFSVPDQVLIFRRRAFVLGAGLGYALANNLRLSSELGMVFAQKVSFTNEGNSQTFQSDQVKPGLQLTLGIIWKPWQNSLRNKERQVTEDVPDYPDDTDEGEMPGF